MKLKLLIITILFFVTTCFGSDNDQLKIKSGMYISNVYGVNSSDQTVRTSFWIWFSIPKTHLYENYFKHDNFFYIKNSRKNQIVYTEKRNLPNNRIWHLYKIKADLYQNWDYMNFPNDKQVFKIIIDSQHLGPTKFIFIPDKQNSQFGKNIKLSGWNFGQFSITSALRDYQSNFGLSDNNYNYSELMFSIPMSHADKNLDFKVYSLLYLACALILFMFLIPIRHFWDRTSLTTVAMLAVIGNMLAIDNVLPPTISLTNIDKLQAFALILMLIMFGFIIIIEYFKDKNIKLARIINITAFFLCAISILIAFIKFIII